MQAGKKREFNCLTRTELQSTIWQSDGSGITATMECPATGGKLKRAGWWTWIPSFIAGNVDEEPCNQYGYIVRGLLILLILIGLGMGARELYTKFAFVKSRTNELTGARMRGIHRGQPGWTTGISGSGSVVGGSNGGRMRGVHAGQPGWTTGISGSGSVVGGSE